LFHSFCLRKEAKSFWNKRGFRSSSADITVVPNTSDQTTTTRHSATSNRPLESNQLNQEILGLSGETLHLLIQQWLPAYSPRRCAPSAHLPHLSGQHGASKPPHDDSQTPHLYQPESPLEPSEEGQFNPAPAPTFPWTARQPHVPFSSQVPSRGKLYSKGQLIIQANPSFLLSEYSVSFWAAPSRERVSTIIFSRSTGFRMSS